MILLLGPIPGDGLRAADLPREPARYRSMLAVRKGQTLPYGISGTSGPYQSRRCERGPRLAYLCRLRAGFDWDRTATLRPRSNRRRPGAKPLRTGFHDHRPMPVAIP